MMIIMLSERTSRPSWAAALSIALEIVFRLTTFVVCSLQIMCSTLNFTQCTWMFTAQLYTVCGFHCTIIVTLSHDTASHLKCQTTQHYESAHCSVLLFRKGQARTLFGLETRFCKSACRSWGTLSVRMLMMLLNGLKLRISASQSSDISIELADRCQFFNSARKGWNL